MAANRRARARTNRTNGGGRTLSEWLPFWTNELGARKCSKRTVENQLKCLRRLMQFTGDADPRTLTVAHVDAWRDHLSESLMDSSTNRYVLTVGTFLGTFLNWLVTEGVLDEAPTLSVALLKLREDEAPPVATAGEREPLREAGTGPRRHRQGRAWAHGCVRL